VDIDKLYDSLNTFSETSNIPRGFLLVSKDIQIDLDFYLGKSEQNNMVFEITNSIEEVKAYGEHVEVVKHCKDNISNLKTDNFPEYFIHLSIVFLYVRARISKTHNVVNQYYEGILNF
jgi:hypothetical protein